MLNAFVLELELHDVTPRVWRRVRVPADMSLADLHHVIQTLMRWDDHHLHVFEVGDREYGPRPEEEWEREHWAGDDDDISIAQALADAAGAITYVYDFGNEWRVRVTAVADEVAPPHHAQHAWRGPLAAGASEAQCLGGELAGPPEDAGGPSAYRDLLARWALEGKSGLPKPRRDRLPQGFDPMRFDVAESNVRLRDIVVRPTQATSATPPFANAEEQLLADVTLLALFLGSWEERSGVRIAWKTVRFEVLDVMSKAGLVVTTPARKSLVLTADGIRRAEAIRARLAASPLR